MIDHAQQPQPIRPMVPADFGYSAAGAFTAISVALGLSGLLYLLH